jgi:hypothetical protein
MKYAEIINEMAFERRRIIRSLENYEPRISEHAVKIIVLPHSQDVPHWKRELLAWCGYLAALRIKTKGTPPMGVNLAFKYLYSDPFVGNELGMTAHYMRLAELRNDANIDADVHDVHARLQAFLTDLAAAIGEGQSVEPAINSLTP